MNKSLVLAMCDILILSTMNLFMGWGPDQKIHDSGNPPVENPTDDPSPVVPRTEYDALQQRIKDLEIAVSNAVSRENEARDKASLAKTAMEEAQHEAEAARTKAAEAMIAEATAKTAAENARNALERAKREAETAKAEAEKAGKGKNLANVIALACILLSLGLLTLFRRRGSSR